MLGFLSEVNSLLKSCLQRREFSFKICPENIVVVVQYNILKIFIMYNKINQIYFILYCSFINE